MKVRVPRKDLANNFSLPEAEDNTSGPMKRGGIADLPLLPKVPRAEILRCDRLLLYWNICEFGSFQNPFAVVMAYLKLKLDSEDLFCWYKLKMWFLWAMATVPAAENHGDDERDFTWYLWWEIYTSIPIWTHSPIHWQQLKIITEMITKTILTITRIVIGYTMKKGIPFWVWQTVNENWNNIIKISQERESHCTTNTSIKRNNSIQKSRNESQSGIQVGKFIIWVRSFVIENYNRIHKVYQSHKNMLASPYSGH